MTPIRSGPKGVVLAGVVAIALFPVALATAANPHTVSYGFPCGITGQSAATGNGEANHPFAATYGFCTTKVLDWATFRGSDGQWYWYDGENHPTYASRHFCTDYVYGTGTCWWADKVQGNHQGIRHDGATTTTFLTSAECVGC